MCRFQPNVDLTGFYEYAPNVTTTQYLQWQHQKPAAPASGAGTPGVRFDRWATLHLFHPLARGIDRDRYERIPILMYHAVQENTTGKSGYYETSTAPSVFAQHMEYLSYNGYRTISLDEAVSAFSQPGPRQRRVVLTFDDGFRNCYTTAYPVLCAYGFTATIFLISGLTAEHSQRFNGIECLTWNEAREMRRGGISFGSHTVTHPELATKTRAEIDSEIGTSKRAIEDRLGVAVTSFSYPFAFPEANIEMVNYLAETLQKHGYENGVSTILGTASQADHKYFLPRLPVNTWDDLRLFQAKLEGGYDWLHSLQYLKKRLGSVINK